MRVGVFSGTFDPVHKGHIAFALEAARSVGLDKVYFMPEVSPWRKRGITHHAHRTAMLKLALKPYPSLEVLELPDKKSTVSTTLPRLAKKFARDDLYLLFGSDVVAYMQPATWPNLDRMLTAAGLVIGLRASDNPEVIKAMLQNLPVATDVHLLTSNKDQASSRQVRAALQNGDNHEDVPQSIASYIAENWLYHSFAMKRT